MTQKLSVEEGNKLIAEFMGCKTKPNGLFYVGDKVWDTFPNGNHYARLDQLAYHSSWDWLMPVVEKIADDEEMLIDFKVSDYHPYFEKIKTALSFVKIGGVWESVIEFIKWYNSNTQPKPLTT